jgi:hypothetical protein
MIRFFSLIAARQDITLQEFHDHWRHPHGTAGRLIPGLRDYVQAHRIDTPQFAQSDTAVHGVAISSFDSAAEALGLLDEPQYTREVQPDEPAFQDLDNNIFFGTTEQTIRARKRLADGAGGADAGWNDLDVPVSVQLLQFVHRTGNPEWAGPDDVDLGERVGAFRHARNFAARDYHGVDEEPFLGARQLWWPTLSHFEQGIASDPAAMERLLAQGGESTTIVASSERWLR